MPKLGSVSANIYYITHYICVIVKDIFDEIKDYQLCKVIFDETEDGQLCFQFNFLRHLVTTLNHRYLPEKRWLENFIIVYFLA